MLMSTDVDALWGQWQLLLASLGVEEPYTSNGFNELKEAYSAPERYYHNLGHIQSMLTVLNVGIDLEPRPPELYLAVWFHDVIYDSRRKDNEEQSALLADARFEQWGIEKSAREEAHRLILLTASHKAPFNDRVGQSLLDADLSILGSATEDYKVYREAIRREYAWVPEEEYCKGRAEVLEHFLKRERIYATERMHELYEAQARQNLCEEIHFLRNKSDI